MNREWLTLRRMGNSVQSLIFLITLSTSALSATQLLAAEGLFSSGCQWFSSNRGQSTDGNVVGTFDMVSADGAPGVKITFDFENIPGEQKSVWAGVQTNDASLQDGSVIRLRVTGNAECVVKLGIIDSADLGHDILIPFSGSAQEIEIPLEYSGFTTHWGKGSSSNKTITFPVQKIFLGVAYREENPKKGEITFADPSAKN